MRRMPALLVFTISLLYQSVPYALATPERPVEQEGRHLDFDNRAPLRCTHEPHLVHTAYISGAKPSSGTASPRSCFSDTDRIGAGYTQFVRNSAVRHLHHRMKG